MPKKTKRLTPAEEGERSARQDAYDIEEALVPNYAIQPLATPLLCKFAKGELDMKKLARDELANRGLNIDGKWVGHEASERLLKRIGNICPACNDEGELISGNSSWHVYECDSCAGIYSSNIPLAEMRKYVLVDEWVEDESKVESEDKRYFDFQFMGVDKQVHRIHGCFDINSKKLLQLG